MLLKRLILFLFHVLLLSKSGIAQTFQESFLNCVELHYSKKNIAIDSLLNSYENFLIKKKYLADEPNGRYSIFLEKMKKNNILEASVPKSTFNSLSTYNVNFIIKECTPKIDVLNFKDYDFYLKFLKIKINLMTNNFQEKEFELKDFAIILLDNFDKEDLDQAFFRTWLLIIIGSVALEEDQTRLSFKKLPPIKN